jgi:glyoxylase-like metal-dependent hydrolase (beta-lactamase superfamily II)
MTPVTATIRMYRLDELGDCFLLTFTAGGSATRMLVDCGSFRNGAGSITRLRSIVAAIKRDLAGEPLNVVVGTHQHNDHLSGFVHCEEAFREIGVGEVWLSWLDDPADPTARTIGRDYNNLRIQIAAARDALDATLKRSRAVRPTAAHAVTVMSDVLGFFGAAEPHTPPELPANAVKILKDLGTKPPLYLQPGRSLDLPGLAPGAVRVHVLGPPRDHDLLFRKDPRRGESYDPSLVAAGAMATRFLAAATRRTPASREEEHYPFNDQYKMQEPTTGSGALGQVRQRYRNRENAWRTIDDDWTEQGEALALFLDTFTNNSSLVLALELVESGKVLLFAADAQTGNWVSWKTVRWERAGVATDDLLARSVFYKVGHHASHNATLVELFEKMNHPDLVALIPVNKKDPNITKKVDPWKMPAKNLFKRLVEKTDHRVLQMDNVNPPECNPAAEPAKAAWRRARVTPRITPLSIELDIVG